jgi:DNA-binding CsgD family transcriptional regulator
VLESMKSDAKLPWPIVRGCPFKAGSCRAIRDLIYIACTECRAGGKQRSGSDVSAQETGSELGTLTSRETELCFLLGLRLTTAEIAACLFISPRTVEKHIERVFQKLKVRSREQLRRKLGIRRPAAFSVGAGETALRLIGRRMGSAHFNS